MALIKDVHDESAEETVKRGERVMIGAGGVCHVATIVLTVCLLVLPPWSRGRQGAASVADGDAAGARLGVRQSALLRVATPDLGYCATAVSTSQGSGGGVEVGGRGLDSPRIVREKAGLLEALSGSVRGDWVCVVGDAVIDLSGERSIGIPGGVTLASDGGLLYTEELDTMPLFRTLGEDVRVTGLRLRGPDSEPHHDLGANGLPNSRAIDIHHPGAEIDGNEIWAWSHAGIYATSGAGASHIHHNYFHHIQRSGLGYGVVVDRCIPLIEYNVFDWGRHAVSATGATGTGYEFRYNTILPNFYSAPIDMHGQGGVAGDWFHIHHNDVQTITPNSQVFVDGVPAQLSAVHNNRFSDAENVVVQRRSGVRFYAPDLVNVVEYGNTYGYASTGQRDE